MHTAPTIILSDTESAFAKIQEAQCGAVYAAAADLQRFASIHGQESNLSMGCRYNRNS
jgi:hypothetical protein